MEEKDAQYYKALYLKYDNASFRGKIMGGILLFLILSLLAISIVSIMAMGTYVYMSRNNHTKVTKITYTKVEKVSIDDIYE